MKKCMSASGLVAFILLFSTLAFGQSNDFLKAKGKVIVDGSEKTFILRGMGLGGWMLQEGYMFRIGAIGRQHRIREKIRELVGEERAARFYDDWLKFHTTRQDIDSLAAWGFNSVRLPMHYGLYTLSVEAEPVPGKDTWLQKGFDMTDSLLAWCKADHMYLILDLHATPGGQGNDLNISDRDPAKPSLWDSEANRKKVIALWRKLAQRYANEPFIGGYDIINEPNWGFDDPRDTRGTKEMGNKPLRALMTEITAAIREVDKKHIIIIEGNGFGNNYNGIFPLWDDNIVVSFHKYGNFNTQAGIQNFLSLQDKYNVPLWLGESGENSNTWFTEAIRLVETRNIGWCWWQLKKMGISNPLEIKVTPSYRMLLDYWLNNGRKPSPEEAQAALNEWLENIKIRNNIYHRDVIDAMFRQVSSSQAIPFKKHDITNGAIINAVDFDLGRNGSA
ncbi:MAG TPA: cellulase family glycosylhydrolase, partial [Puia sp.]|nr:cellulase family glycosylhydrolase [Puia sp.]